MFLPTFLAKIMVFSLLIAVYSLLFFCDFSPPLNPHGEKFATGTNEQKRNPQPATFGCKSTFFDTMQQVEKKRS